MSSEPGVPTRPPAEPTTQVADAGSSTETRKKKSKKKGAAVSKESIDKMLADMKQRSTHPPPSLTPAPQPAPPQPSAPEPPAPEPLVLPGGTSTSPAIAASAGVAASISTAPSFSALAAEEPSPQPSSVPAAPKPPTTTTTTPDSRQAAEDTEMAGPSDDAGSGAKRRMSGPSPSKPDAKRPALEDSGRPVAAPRPTEDIRPNVQAALPISMDPPPISLTPVPGSTTAQARPVPVLPASKDFGDQVDYLLNFVDGEALSALFASAEETFKGQGVQGMTILQQAVQKRVAERPAGPSGTPVRQANFYFGINAPLSMPPRRVYYEF
ncbi:hypothetical protein CONPUDRAFT_152745 [Coniophora puteana RWD-64-598 SS2]|uniref:Uncharacterized protein n=1 Tax=Coniophora puteana (strain RWD-64-598) TaxID=741705 RepID=A0A5M3MRR3_CONPW|nr:uncharacterized protein CONPUDRAFT_152745 [Coniophora puteana RWD-64-598 SS2]EIW81843.1 hypothetical protein CONPUDRAFT_152745 [Coniophora puteana RWD-64-598 SS2]